MRERARVSCRHADKSRQTLHWIDRRRLANATRDVTIRKNSFALNCGRKTFYGKKYGLFMWVMFFVSYTNVCSIDKRLCSQTSLFEMQIFVTGELHVRRRVGRDWLPASSVGAYRLFYFHEAVARATKRTDLIPDTAKFTQLTDQARGLGNNRACGFQLRSLKLSESYE